MEKAWQRYEGDKFREINRVSYDPQQVGLKQLEDWLKEARTYRDTVENHLPDKGEPK